MLLQNCGEDQYIFFHIRQNLQKDGEYFFIEILSQEQYLWIRVFYTFKFYLLPAENFTTV